MAVGGWAEGAFTDPMKSAGRKIRPAPTGITPVRWLCSL